MFDVSWTDPTRETVGQRKTRKEQVANGTSGKSPALSRVSSFRSSNSSGSTFGHQKSSLLNVFGTSRKEAASRLRHPTEAQTTQNPAAGEPQSRRLSSFTASSDSSGQETPGTIIRIPSTGFFAGSPSYYSEGELSAQSDASESVFSGWTGKSTKRESTSTWGSVVESTTSSRKILQPLSKNEFVTQSTEVAVSSCERSKDAEQTATIVDISLSGSVPVQVPGKASPPPNMFIFPLPNSEASKAPAKIASKKDGTTQRNVFPVTKRGKPSYTWKPSEMWECDDGAPGVSPPGSFSVPLRPIREKCQRSSPSEIGHLRRSIRRMQAATPRIVLERLKEEWVEVADASVYRELELEKQLWMLTALRTLKKKNSLDDIVEGHVSGPTKILSLYENHASSSSLAALTTATEVHHLSPNPLSPNLYPSIHPLSVPGPTSQLPYASNSFDSIHAFSIASLLPASSIPSILKECHRTLISAPKPLPSHSKQSIAASPPQSSLATIALLPSKSTRGGTLHLTILDPSPLPETLGPRLRAWLDNHLVVNLEKQFCCINPSRLFPIWLSDAGLRAEGSTIVNVRFFASVPPLHPSNTSLEETEHTKQELKSTVGRMLWKEMWGAYVQGERWWWEDENIVEECNRIGTAWEYVVIEAVKEG